MDNNQNYTQEPINMNPQGISPFNSLKDPLFLTLCILITVLTALSFNVITLLLTIGMWMAYVSASKNESPISGVKLCSIAVKIDYILTWVASGLLALFGFLFVALSGAMADGIYEILTDSTLADIFESFGAEEALEEFFETLDEIMFETGMGLDSFLQILSITLGIGLIIAAIVCVIMNLVYTRNIVKFTTSLKNNLETRAPIVKANTVKVWMLVLAILNGISTLGSISSAGMLGLLTSAANLAMFIIAYILMKKYFE